MTTADPKKCFVIMPFSLRREDVERYHSDQSHWDEVFEGLIIPATEHAGLLCERDDADTSSRLIADNIWRKIEASDIVLCDLSTNNPNVMLELGWALRADKRFVLIKDDLTEYSFDLNQFYTFTYSHKLQPRSLKNEIPKLAQTLVATLEDDTKKYSIVRKVSVSFSTIKEMKDGNVQVELLDQILQGIKGLSRQGVARPATRHDSATDETRAHIYFSNRPGKRRLTSDDAVKIKTILQARGIVSTIFKHEGAPVPNALHIGSEVEADKARLAISAVPYEIQYLYTVDEGARVKNPRKLIVIGSFVSDRDLSRRGLATTFEVDKETLASLMDPTLSDARFHERLRAITQRAR